MLVFFFFKQKTAYEMRISDWSSDVCSSDLPFRDTRSVRRIQEHGASQGLPAGFGIAADALVLPCRPRFRDVAGRTREEPGCRNGRDGDRKSVVEGKSVSVSVDLGGCRIITNK